MWKRELGAIFRESGYGVSEELSSAETLRLDEMKELLEKFQKNLVVWKRFFHSSLYR